jgi:hypothetical protein
MGIFLVISAYQSSSARVLEEDDLVGLGTLFLRIGISQREGSFAFWLAMLLFKLLTSAMKVI